MSEHLSKALEEAIARFAKRNQGANPEHYIVYRDGVGDGQRKDVLAEEVSQMREAIKKYANKAAKTPSITVVVVNKRITQRFFLPDSRGNMVNPPSGSLIDSTLVQSEDSDQEFDFYLVPQTTT